jgi:hypothetical protein
MRKFPGIFVSFLDIDGDNIKTISMYSILVCIFWCQSYIHRGIMRPANWRETRICCTPFVRHKFRKVHHNRLVHVTVRLNINLTFKTSLYNEIWRLSTYSNECIQDKSWSVHKESHLVNHVKVIGQFWNLFGFSENS